MGFIAAFSPREAICPICLNRGLKRILRIARKILSESGCSRFKDSQELKAGACLAPTMDAVPQIVLYLAPAGRHVYSTRHIPNNQSPRGAHVGYNALCVNAQRFIAAFRPREATCPICLNRGLGGLGGGHR